MHTQPILSAGLDSRRPDSLVFIFGGVKHLQLNCLWIEPDRAQLQFDELASPFFARLLPLHDETLGCSRHGSPP